MRLKPTVAVLSAVAASSALFVTGGASAAQPASATGGGQTVVGTDAEDGGGAGNTIAFTARETADGADGQVQYVDRTGGTGQGQLVSHGIVDCFRAVGDEEGGMAYIEGVWTKGDETGRFNLYVEDNGEGANAPNDIVMFVEDGETPECDFDGPGQMDPRIELARGNVQVRPGAGS